jgi:hypothetical protein
VKSTFSKLITANETNRENGEKNLGAKNSIFFIPYNLLRATNNICRKWRGKKYTIYLLEKSSHSNTPLAMTVRHSLLIA